MVRAAAPQDTCLAEEQRLLAVCQAAEVLTSPAQSVLAQRGTTPSSLHPTWYWLIVRRRTFRENEKTKYSSHTSSKCRTCKRKDEAGRRCYRVIAECDSEMIAGRKGLLAALGSMQLETGLEPSTSKACSCSPGIQNHHENNFNLLLTIVALLKSSSWRHRSAA